MSFHSFKNGDSHSELIDTGLWVAAYEITNLRAGALIKE